MAPKKKRKVAKRKRLEAKVRDAARKRKTKSKAIHKQGKPNAGARPIKRLNLARAKKIIGRESRSRHTLELVTEERRGQPVTRKRAVRRDVNLRVMKFNPREQTRATGALKRSERHPKPRSCVKGPPWTYVCR